MIEFKEIRWKNFLKTGNYFNSIRLDEYPITLVYGKNGSGKSTVVEAMIFALYGKSYRGINKNQLINSINGSETVVEIEFSNGTSSYLVRRGIKPNVFEIYENETLVDLSSTTKDYQEHLNQIIGVNMNVFTQTVTVGSSSYVPFMKLSKNDRRNFVESALDLDIFTEMMKLARENVNELDDAVNSVVSDITSNQALVSELSTTLNKLQASTADKMKELTSEMDKERASAKELAVELSGLKKSRKELTVAIEELTNSVTKSDQLSKTLQEITSEISHKAKTIKQISERDKCPTCNNAIDESVKKEAVLSLKKELEPSVGKRADVMKELESLSDSVNRYNHVIDEISVVDKNISNIISKLEGIQQYVSRIEKTINSFSEDNDSDEIIQRIDAYRATLKDLEDTRERTRAEMRLYKIIVSYLKDDGVKREIVNQYIPLFNKIVNEHLAHFEFFVEFELDEDFNESIKSRHRDTFSYYNFSEGERSRIDFSILFAWRRITQLKNSFDTNLMLCDELFDSAMDEDGNNKITDLLLKYSQNAIIISHNQQMNEIISEAIEFYDDGGFSYMRQGER